MQDDGKIFLIVVGLDAFNIILLETIECKKEKLSIHRKFYKTNIEIFMNISNKILEL